MSRPRVAVITGASAGVGRALAHVLAERGYHIGLLARGEERLAGALAEVRALGGDGIAVRTDVSDHGQVAKAADEVRRVLGPIDVWVNNAMVTVLGRVQDVTPEEFARITEVTYLGTVHGTMVALEHMRERDRGHIVQVGSALAHRAIPLQSAYCGAKHAIRGFTDSLRSELLHARSHILLSMAQLPAMNTPQFAWSRTRLPHAPQPVPPIYDPHVAARAVERIIGTRCREIWVAGSSVKAIVGAKVAPGYADRVLAEQGFSGQQTDRDLSDDRPDNLFTPAPGDFGTTGTFDDRARTFSAGAWLAARWQRLISSVRPRPDFAEEVPPGWTRNPAAVSQRLPIVALALLGFTIAGYLGLYQIGWIDQVWDPFFGDGTEQVLSSPLSRLLPIPDAWLGALGYALDAVTGLVGGRKRWKTLPWVVIMFGLAVGPLGLVSVALVIAQPLSVGAWCSLCLLTALISIAMIGPAMDEVLASLQYLRRVHDDPSRSTWRAFFGLADEQKRERRSGWLAPSLP